MGRISFGAARFVAYSKMQNFKVLLDHFTLQHSLILHYYRF